MSDHDLEVPYEKLQRSQAEDDRAGAAWTLVLWLASIGLAILITWSLR